MSLINQMLKDLEQRRQPDGPQRAAVTAVSGAPAHSERRRWPLVVGIAAVLAAAGGWWLWPSPPTVPAAAVETAVPAVTPQPPAAIIAEEVAAPEAPSSVEPVEETSASHQLLTVQLSEQRDQLRLVLEFDRPVDYQLSQQAGHLLRLQLSPTSDPSSLPEATGVLVEQLQWQGGDETAQLVLTTQRDVDWRLFALPADGHYGWRLVVQAVAVAEEEPVVPRVAAPSPPAPADEASAAVSPAAQPAAEKSVSVKRAVDDAAQRRAQLQRRLTAARDQGDTVETAAALEQLLQFDSAQPLLRHELISLRVAQQQWSAAIGLAEQGALHHPQQLEWVTLQARLLAEQGAYDQALSRLAEREPPSLAAAPEYYALQAGLLQKSGDFERSAQIYQALCRVFPRQGKWWLGWAVSEAQRGDRAAAIRYFKQALATPGLSPALQQYATTQLGRLTESR